MRKIQKEKKLVRKREKKLEKKREMSPFSDFGFWMSHKIEIFSEKLKKEREQKRERERREHIY